MIEKSMSRLEMLCKKYGWNGPRDIKHRKQIILDAAYGNLLYDKPWLTREDFERMSKDVHSMSFNVKQKGGKNNCENFPCVYEGRAYIIASRRGLTKVA
jgi:hypothetical protein